MAIKKRTRGNSVPLIVENHPEDYNGYPFITLIQYRNQHFLTIIDNATDKHVKAFVLDLCGPAQVDEEMIINTTIEWFKNSRDKYPISFEFSRLGVSNDTAKIYRSFNIEFITRAIGPLPRFEMGEVYSTKRRRRKPIPNELQVQKKS